MFTKQKNGLYCGERLWWKPPRWTRGGVFWIRPIRYFERGVVVVLGLSIHWRSTALYGAGCRCLCRWLCWRWQWRCQHALVPKGAGRRCLCWWCRQCWQALHSVIKTLDKSKATGPDMIYNKLLIATVDIITEPLTILFNRCLNEGIFPNIWKIVHVTPLQKKKDPKICVIIIILFRC